jgi:hypothetical protein
MRLRRGHAIDRRGQRPESGQPFHAIGFLERRLALEALQRGEEVDVVHQRRNRGGWHHGTGFVAESVPAADGQSRSLGAHLFTRRTDRPRPAIDHALQKMWMTAFEGLASDALSNAMTIAI